jgi:hypothetical protein
MDHLGLFEVTKEAQHLGNQGHQIDRRPSFQAGPAGIMPLPDHNMVQNCLEPFPCGLYPAWCVISPIYELLPQFLRFISALSELVCMECC